MNYLILFPFLSILFMSSPEEKPVVTITDVAPVTISLGKIEVKNHSDSAGQFFINVPQLFEEGWDQLPQAKFWRFLIKLSPDSGIINFASSRKIIEIVSASDWQKRSDTRKEAYRDSLRKLYQLPAEEKIFFTKGKSDFYDFNGAMQTIDQGVKIFEQEKTDPFYAQAILLIESPGKCAKSPVGACGSFQLMKGVAIQMGMKVNGIIDERKDFDKSAIGAARLIRTICVPETKRILGKYNIAYNETDLWFRLLVLHVYHAGAGNVGNVMNVLQPASGDINLITQLWQTKAGSFGNASQNYSQVAIASLLELDDIIYSSCDEIFFHPLSYKN